MNRPPLVLTLALDAESFSFFEQQRRQFFPPERNFLPAHVTLFHALPGEQVDMVGRDLEEVCATQNPLPVRVTGLRSLGRGVAYRLEAPELGALRRRLVRRWAPWLGPQDLQKHDPHVTVQNKVDPATARALLAELEASFVPFTIVAEGLVLWWYRGGPWEQAGRFPFKGASSASTERPFLSG